MPVFSLFRNRKQSGARKFFLCRCSVFGFQRGLLLSLWVFALSFFGLHPPVLSSYCPIF